jgi:hypothetical protein
VTVLDLPGFVNVVLGLDTAPLHVARSDVNADGAADGRDVRGFVEIVTP